MRWQIEGGKVLENGKHVANYSSVEAGQLQHDGAKHCPAVNDTLFFRWEAAREYDPAWCSRF
jgi:hypothetical protein